ncbi:MAG: phosphate ABC transporter permease PstA [Desulfobacterales bacterium]|jgi:phosphate transport system permease protein|nr:phosphate ABC transporter permease PstA [Desulfobacterales bacterium]
MNSQGTRVRTIDIVKQGLAKRYRAERRFRLYGLSAIAISIISLALLFISIIGNGYTAFWQTRIRLDIFFDPEVLRRDALASADYESLVRAALQSLFPEVQERRERRQLNGMISSGAAYELRKLALSDPDIIGKTVPVWVFADDDIDMIVKGQFSREVAEENRRVTDQQLAWLDRLQAEGRVEKQFNLIFFRSGDSREPEQAGIWGAVMGSFFTLVITLLLSFPIGVAAAVYLEEFAHKNRWTDLIEVNINNLAAVPSIVFGLLGLAVFLNFFGLPRSAPLVGGLVLTLMTLPTIIIASRSALKSVPPSIREAALGVGASKMQMVVHHVLPLALPGMLTGTIIGMARALGESAPLLMIGMVAFIVDVPKGFFDPSTVLPVQIYLWADSPERAFVERTSAAIIVLLAFLLVMNAAAVILRKKFERRW